MRTVYLPGEISALFADAHDNLPAIIGKPSDDDVQHLRRRDFQALYDIDLGDGTGATGLTISEVDHKAANANQVFDRADRALEAYVYIRHLQQIGCLDRGVFASASMAQLC